MNVRLTQIDGKLPNLALMALGKWHRERGDNVTFTRSASRDLFEPEYGRVYASCIFTFSAPKLKRFKEQWPDAIIGGTGSGTWQTLGDVLGTEPEGYDYTDYPSFDASIGFTQRGCRLKCPFCVVPRKEGKIQSVSTIADIWRGDPYPKHLHLLDNDFFGQPLWRERLSEIREGDFKVCFNQGINVRMITEEVAEALTTIDYRDDGFKTKRIYTAWDNLGQEAIFFKGMDKLQAAGIPGEHVMAYMLIGYDKRETWDDILYRFNKMVERGIRPYPMVFNNERPDLKRFQRWAVRQQYRFVPWREYDANRKGPRDFQQLELST